MTKPSLADYSSDELLEELHRREINRERNKPVDRWCVDCAHFKFWKARSDPPDNYNPCQKKEEMSFRMPAEEDGPSPDPSTWGFYRRGCWKFAPRPPEPAPPEPMTTEEIHANAARAARKRRGGAPLMPRTIPGQVVDRKDPK